jgi:hypothetical protein
MNIYAFVGIRTSNPSQRADAGQRRTQCGHGDRTSAFLTHYNIAPRHVVSPVGYRSALMLRYSQVRVTRYTHIFQKHTKATKALFVWLTYS